MTLSDPVRPSCPVDRRVRCLINTLDACSEMQCSTSARSANCVRSRDVRADQDGIQIGREFNQPFPHRNGLRLIFGIAERAARFEELDGMVEAIAGEERVPACRNEMQHLMTQRVAGRRFDHNPRSQAVAPGNQIGESGPHDRLDAALENAFVIVRCVQAAALGL